jgi:hypothetical protein
VKNLLIVIISLISSQTLFGQSFKYINPEVGDSCTIIRSIIDSANFYEQLVYIDNKINSKQKNYVKDFKTNEDDLELITSSYNKIIQDYGYKPNKLTEKLPQKWVRLYKYNGDWILYNNIEFNFRFMLNDSSLITFYMDGPMSKVIVGYNKTRNVHKFKLLDYDWYDTKSTYIEELNIYVIEPEKYITLWEFQSKNGSEQLIMIPEERTKDFSIIAIRTTDLMGNEQDILDEIEFKKLKSRK